MMGAITMSRVVAALAALSFTGGCNDTSGPGGQLGEPGRRGMTVVPRFATIGAGQVIALTARLRDADGNRIETVTIGWASSNDAVATVTSRGEVMGRAEGRAIITATAEGDAETSTIRVVGSRGPKPQ
jgi:hypothetical protein